MALRDILLKDTTNYIAFTELLMQLSGLNDEPLRDIVAYLLKTNLNSITLYRPTLHNTFEPIRVSGTTTYDLEKILEIISVLGDEDWIFENNSSLETLDNEVKVPLITHLGDGYKQYFKITDLDNFQPFIEAKLLPYVDNFDKKIITTNDSQNMNSSLNEKEQLNISSKLTTELENAKYTIQKLQEENARLREQFDWDNIDKLIHEAFSEMDSKIYPLELHLAIVIWIKIYLSKELTNNYLTKHSERFKIIINKAKENQSDLSDALLDRLQKVTTPKHNKSHNGNQQIEAIKDIIDFYKA